MSPLEGADFGLACLCGYENFERIIVRRPGREPVVTEFVACVGCRAMFYAPIPPSDPMPLRPRDNMGAIGGPPHARADSDAALKRDAAMAAKD